VKQPHITDRKLVADLFEDEQILDDLRRIMREEQQREPVANVLERCTDGWFVTVGRMVTLW